MPRKPAPKKPAKKSPKKPIEQYEHSDQRRVNNPPVGLVTPETDPDAGRKQYDYDPHLDPQLVWAGKAEHTSFEVPTVSLHVHERIDPKTIITAVRKLNGNGNGNGHPSPSGRGAGGEGALPQQLSLFEQPAENLPIRDAIEFYRHQHNWTNRLIAGDSLLVMNSLLEKEGLAGKVQMVYLDPPYGIRYGSNFQPFVNRRDVKDGRDEDLAQEPETIRAFRDTWELGIHSYLTYLRDRLLLARELLHESGSIFVQISDENAHHLRELLDEVFGQRNCLPTIAFRKTTGAGSPSGYVEAIPQTFDYLLWYAKERALLKVRRLSSTRDLRADENFRMLEDANGERRVANKDEDIIELSHQFKVFQANPITSQTGGPTTQFEVELDGKTYTPSKGGWKTSREGMNKLAAANRLMGVGATLRFIRYHDDFHLVPVIDIWDDTRQSGFGERKTFVVQTAPKVVSRCLLMTTDPGDLVFDPTCGSGTTAYVAEQWGRRWITCDTSRVAVTLAKQRLLTATFDYYQLAHAENSSLPSPSGRGAGGEGAEGAANIARSGETVRQAEWRDELLKTGIRGRSAQRIEFSRVEVLGGTRYLNADAETKPQHPHPNPLPKGEGTNLPSPSGRGAGGEGAETPQRAVISFGPQHAPLEQRQVARALEEAESLRPRPKLVIFAAFQFDPEAAKDIDETNWPGVTLLKAQMNADLLTDDLKKKRTSNDSYWLVGQPDVEVLKVAGEPGGSSPRSAHYRVAIHGFDYYNTRTGAIDSGDTAKIAMWLLDTDYDGRSLYPRQVFFPMSGENDGWSRLAKNLKAEIDEDAIEQYRGTVSLPFAAGAHNRIAVKIIDDRGIESLRIVQLAD